MYIKYNYYKYSIFLCSETGDTRTCQVSRKCWDLMTSPGYEGYSLSHEVFYLQIGEQVTYNSVSNSTTGIRQKINLHKYLLIIKFKTNKKVIGKWLFVIINIFYPE